MDLRTLGATGLPVTSLGLGTLTMSPLQRGLPVEEGARVILAALEGGIRFLDTAQQYQSYPHVARALAEWRGAAPTLASKSAARTRADMARAVDEALASLGVGVIDAFLLHAVKDEEDLRQREGALEALLAAKAQGKIRAIGASSHWLRALRVLAADSRIEVLHPIYNRDGFGILDGTLEEMRGILQGARTRGLGVYAMKPLGGGHLGKAAAEALAWILAQPEIDAAVVGMSGVDEVQMNLAVARGEAVDPAFARQVAGRPRRLFINEVLCRHCGRCSQDCPQEAIAMNDGRPQVDLARCVLCGYCAPHCPAFAIRVI